MADAQYAVAQANELQDGEKKEIRAGNTAVLLARIDGVYHAIGANCPHYGARLVEGLLCGDRLTCPWHKASFQVSTGCRLDPPAIDDLALYPVEVRDGEVFVTVPQPAAPVAFTVREKRHFAIVGAGAAGLSAAEALREFGFDGRISLISAEPELPYDRTKLSKEFLSGNAGLDQLPQRPEDFYHRLAIDRVHKQVAEVSPDSLELEFDDGTSLRCDGLVLALGGIPRPLEVPGSGLGNIFLLRTVADAQQIATALCPGVRTAVVGGSFIGLEVASCFAMRNIPVMVIVPEKAPFARQFGPEVGRAFGQWHEQHGVQFRLGVSVDRISGTGMVRELVLQSGERIPADVVVVGGGVRPATEPLRQFSLREDGGIDVDEYLCVAPNIYAAGDIAAFPDAYSGRRVRIEHWRVAQQHGRIAAANLLGRRQPFRGAPYFWTNHFGTRFDYVGHAEQWSEVIVDGNLDKLSFIAYYIDQDGQVLAASACQRDLEVAALEGLFGQHRVPSAPDIRQGVDLAGLAKERAQAALA